MLTYYSSKFPVYFMYLYKIDRIDSVKAIVSKSDLYQTEISPINKNLKKSILLEEEY